MRLRAIHIASVLLLLASLGAADGSTLRKGTRSVGGQYIAVLLGQDHAAACMGAGLDHIVGETLKVDLPAAALAQHRTIWTMRPPAAHSAALHAVTSRLG
jgi:hypothetical protein